MIRKRLCYLTSQGLTAFSWRRGEIQRDGSFAPTERGYADFSRYVAAQLDSLYYVLADVVEEDFFQENVPYVRGADRRALLGRRLAQRYRDTALAIPVSLGYESHAGRREERILYTSFTNAQQFHPWLSALRSQEARLAGVFSAAFVAASLGKRIGFKVPRYLIVSLQEAGLRQTYIENGRMRFSRLTRVNASDPRGTARDCASEALRIYQYLSNARVLPREMPPLDVVVIAPSEYKALYDAECTSSSRLQFHVRDLDQVGRSLGIKAAPAETLAEGVFLHVLAQSAPSDQFADDDLRRFFDVWRARMGLILAGAATFGVCLLVAAVQVWSGFRLEQQAAVDLQREARASNQYSELQSTFPKTPASSENLRAMVRSYQLLQKQTTFPGDMFADISRAVSSLPQIEIERIEWDAGSDAVGGGGSGREAKAAPAQGGGSESVVRQTAEISGRLVIPQASDYRAITALIEQFAEALRQRPGMEVIRTQLPFDINAEKSISGDIGTARTGEVPRFSIAVSRRAGA